MGIEEDLPDGWKLLSIADIGKVKGGKRLPKGEGYSEVKTKFPYLRVTDFEKLGVRQNKLKYLSTETQAKIKNYTISCEDVFISIAGTIGEVGVIPRNLDGANLTENAAKITNLDSVYNYYLAYALSSQSAQAQIKQHTIATTQPKLSLFRIEKINIPVPPLSEQRKVVEKIEELFSELDKGIENLKTAQQQLKVYRQAVLKAAFEGKLTTIDKLWKDVKLEHVGNAIDPQPSHRTPPKFSGGIPYISIKDFNSELDTIDFTSARIVPPKVLKEHQSRYKLEIGDFVIGKIGTIGKPVRLTLPQNYALSANIVLIQPRKINSTFLYYFFQSNQIEKEFTDGKSATSQAAFGIKKVRELNIKLPSDKEQLQVVQEIESRLSVCDRIEESIGHSIKQAEALRQSILKKAFEGKLLKEKVKPLFKPKNTYFYQMQLLGIVAAASKEKGINHGEMTIAKYAYLLDKVYQIPTYYEYKRWHLGPYSPEIKKAINNAKFFAKKDNSIEVKDIETLTKYTNPYSDKLKFAVNDLSDIFSAHTGKERSHQIELLATVCKVIEDIQSTDFKAVRTSMTEWKIDLKTTHFKNKAEKFKEQETEECITLIINKGWSKNLMLN